MTGAEDRLERVATLFHRARRLKDVDRRDLLDSTCEGDPALREEVEALLRAHEAADDAFLAEPALGGLDEIPVVEGNDDALPTHIGSYAILSRRGEGGMGVVYLAEQPGTGRRVAVKVIRPGLATPLVLRRFEQEAQVLGRLRHPGIAQVYEAGVHEDAAGRTPFIVMEYAEGVSLSRYVRDSQPSVTERLELFVEICRAVQHAHQKGVIHRDLKPGNILVEDARGIPKPKILDFGIARLSDPDAQAITQKSDVPQLLGTVQYMSPEQAAGDTAGLDTRSDVYALGIVLFEILTGRLPYEIDDAPLHEALRVIARSDPRPLASVDPSFRGELSTIVAKALERDRDHRYASASELAADIERYLNHEPISAQPSSAIYQLRKFGRRHRALVSVAGALLLLLVTGVIVTTSLASAAIDARNDERTAKEDAERRFEEVRTLAKVFLFELDEQLVHVAGSLPARRTIVSTGLTYLDQLAADVDDDVELLQEVMAGYVKLGDVQGLPTAPNLGNPAGALESYAKAVELGARLATLAPAIESGTLVHAHSKLATVYLSMNDPESALEHAQTARRLAMELVATQPDDTASLDLHAQSLTQLASLHQRGGRSDDALAALEEARTVQQRLVALHPEDPLTRRNMAVTAFQMGEHHWTTGDADAATAHFVSFRDDIAALVRDYPHNAVFRNDLASGHERLGEIALTRGDTDAALAAYQRGATILEELLSIADTDPNVGHALSMKLTRIGEIQTQLRDLTAAEATYRRSVELSRVAADRNRENTGIQRQLGVAYYKMGEINIALASDAPASTRRSRWQAAHDSFVDAHRQFVEMRDGGLLWASDAGVPDAIQAEIDRCREAIAAPASSG